MRKWLVAAWMVLIPTIANAENFIVHGPQGPEIARKFDEIKTRLATEWFGADSPDFLDPVEVHILFGKASGNTQYRVVDGYVRGARQIITSPSLKDLYENTGPHEIMHLLIAEWFGGDLPRWMNEGLATYVEGKSVHDLRRKQIYASLTARPSRGLPFTSTTRRVTLFGPHDRHPYPEDLATFYSQSFSVIEFIVPRLGKRQTIRYFEDAIWNPQKSQTPWTDATKKHLGYDSLKSFENGWVAWLAENRKPEPKEITVAQTMGSCSSGNCGPSMMAPPIRYMPSQPRVVSRPWSVPRRVTPPKMVEVTPRVKAVTPDQDPLPPNPPPVTTADDLMTSILQKVKEELRKPEYRGPAGPQGPAGADGSPGSDGADGPPGTVEGVDLSEIESRIAAIENSTIVVDILGENTDGTTFVHESFVVPLGGNVQIPPQVLRIRDGNDQFRVTAPLGEPIKILLRDLEVGGIVQ